jgi:hypothetical protein
MSRRPFTDAHPKKIRGSSDLKPAVAGPLLDTAPVACRCFVWSPPRSASRVFPFGF